MVCSTNLILKNIGYVLITRTQQVHIFLIFAGGLDPNLADLAVFGVLRPIRDLKSGRDMVEHTRIGKWFSEMDRAVGQSSRVWERS